MIFTLHRYIFRELLKVFILASVALTLMLSLAGILRPVQEYGVGPRQVIHLMGYFLPITLTFVLPIAALFAASLVYGRFAGDNEINASKASGISILSLIYPGLALAIIVAIANLILSFHVMPAFIHRAQKSLKSDAKSILFRNIRRKGYYSLPPDGRYVIYADLADAKTNTLAGVIIVNVADAAIEKIITAESATVRFQPDKKFNPVQITARNACRMEGDHFVSLGYALFDIEFGSMLDDDIKFKKLHDMKQIRDVDLTLFAPIDKLARKLYSQITTEMLAENVSAKISNPSDKFYKLLTGTTYILFTADKCTVARTQQIELTQNVIAVEQDALTKQNIRTMRCERALLNTRADQSDPTLTLELYNPTWKSPEGRKETAWPWLRIRGLILPKNINTTAAQFKVNNRFNAKLLACPKSLAMISKPTPQLLKLHHELKRKIARTLAEIEAETHSRLVFGVGCVVMIIIGIALGIMFKGGHLLSAFGLSCIPAAILMVSILMGKNIAENPGSQGASGIAIMWLGFVTLCVLAVFLYQKLLKN